MTPEFTLILALATAVITAISTSLIAPLVQAWLSRNKTNSEIANEIASGGVSAVNALEKVLDRYQKNDEYQRAEIAAITESRKQRDKEMEVLSAAIAANKAQTEKDTLETQSLRHEVGLLRAQVAELQDKNARYTRIIEKLLKSLDEAMIPMPDLNGDLTDTLSKFKLRGSK